MLFVSSAYAPCRVAAYGGFARLSNRNALHARSASPQSGPRGIKAVSSGRGRARLVVTAKLAGSGDDVESDGDSEMDAFRAQLESQAPPKPQDADVDVVDMTGQPLTGEELRGLVVARWGRPYDTRITQRRNKLNQLKLYLQVMWKFLGQKSFPLSEKRYMEQLDAVAELVTEWGCADQVRYEIKNAKKNPVLDTTGANAVSICLDVDTSDS